jgi:hypothetical protein
LQIEGVKAKRERKKMHFNGKREKERGNRTVDNSEGETQEKVTWSRYTKLERVNATREKKSQRKKGKNVDGDRHFYEKSQEDATSTSKREKKKKHESQICSQTQYPSLSWLLFFFENSANKIVLSLSLFFSLSQLSNS